MDALNLSRKAFPQVFRLIENTKFPEPFLRNVRLETVKTPRQFGQDGVVTSDLTETNHNDNQNEVDAGLHQNQRETAASSVAQRTTASGAFAAATLELHHHAQQENGAPSRHPLNGRFQKVLHPPGPVRADHGGARTASRVSSASSADRVSLNLGKSLQLVQGLLQQMERKERVSVFDAGGNNTMNSNDYHAETTKAGTTLPEGRATAVVRQNIQQQLHQQQHAKTPTVRVDLHETASGNGNENASMLSKYDEDATTKTNIASNGNSSVPSRFKPVFASSTRRPQTATPTAAAANSYDKEDSAQDVEQPVRKTKMKSFADVVKRVQEQQKELPHYARPTMASLFESKSEKDKEQAAALREKERKKFVVEGARQKLKRAVNRATQQEGAAVVNGALSSAASPALARSSGGGHAAGEENSTKTNSKDNVTKSPPAPGSPKEEDENIQSGSRAAKRSSSSSPPGSPTTQSQYYKATSIRYAPSSAILPDGRVVFFSSVTSGMVQHQQNFSPVGGEHGTTTGMISTPSTGVNYLQPPVNLTLGLPPPGAGLADPPSTSQSTSRALPLSAATASSILHTTPLLQESAFLTKPLSFTGSGSRTVGLKQPKTVQKPMIPGVEPIFSTFPDQNRTGPLLNPVGSDVRLVSSPGKQEQSQSATRATNAQVLVQEPSAQVGPLVVCAQAHENQQQHASMESIFTLSGNAVGQIPLLPEYKLNFACDLTDGDYSGAGEDFEWRVLRGSATASETGGASGYGATTSAGVAVHQLATSPTAPSILEVDLDLGAALLVWRKLAKPVSIDGGIFEDRVSSFISPPAAQDGESQNTNDYVKKLGEPPLGLGASPAPTSAVSKTSYEASPFLARIATAIGLVGDDPIDELKNKRTPKNNKSDSSDETNKEGHRHLDVAITSPRGGPHGSAGKSLNVLEVPSNRLPKTFDSTSLRVYVNSSTTTEASEIRAAEKIKANPYETRKEKPATYRSISLVCTSSRSLSAVCLDADTSVVLKHSLLAAATAPISVEALSADDFSFAGQVVATNYSNYSTSSSSSLKNHDLLSGEINKTLTDLESYCRITAKCFSRKTSAPVSLFCRGLLRKYKLRDYMQVNRNHLCGFQVPGIRCFDTYDPNYVVLTGTGNIWVVHDHWVSNPRVSRTTSTTPQLYQSAEDVAAAVFNSSAAAVDELDVDQVTLHEKTPGESASPRPRGGQASAVQPVAKLSPKQRKMEAAFAAFAGGTAIGDEGEEDSGVFEDGAPTQERDSLSSLLEKSAPVAAAAAENSVPAAVESFVDQEKASGSRSRYFRYDEKQKSSGSSKPHPHQKLQSPTFFQSSAYAEGERGADEAERMQISSGGPDEEGKEDHPDGESPVVVPAMHSKMTSSEILSSPSTGAVTGSMNIKPPIEQRLYTERTVTVPFGVEKLGFGFHIRDHFIVDIVADSWAETSGVQKGEYIVKVCGEPYAELTPERRQNLLAHRRPCEIVLRSYFVREAVGEKVKQGREEEEEKLEDYLKNALSRTNSYDQEMAPKALSKSSASATAYLDALLSSSAKKLEERKIIWEGKI
ncbi:unnamed protein product [Amoebophrya sp. A120]|nr:unnamed protein product [Amoebophrya sp. A120]|eukprot:GSA120T00008075001.1